MFSSRLLLSVLAGHEKKIRMTLFWEATWLPARAVHDVVWLRISVASTWLKLLIVSHNGR